MPDASRERAADLVIATAADVEVRRVQLMISMKRTRKVDDDYQSFESSESWTLEHPSGMLISPAVAKRVVVMHTPALVRKVLLDHLMAGTISKEEFKDLYERAETTSKQVLDRLDRLTREGPSGSHTPRDNDVHRDQPDASRPAEGPAAGD